MENYSPINLLCIFYNMFTKRVIGKDRHLKAKEEEENFGSKSTLNFKLRTKFQTNFL